MASRYDEDWYAEEDEDQIPNIRPQPRPRPRALVQAAAPPTPQAASPILLNAITAMSEDRAKHLLRNLARTMPAVATFLESKLTVPIQRGRPVLGKRKAVEVCTNCGVEYGVEANMQGDCRYHPGVKEVDYESDIWCDHNEDCHGSLEDCVEDGEECYDEGAVWTCCSGNEAAAFCVSSKHEPELDPARSAKLLRSKYQK